MEQAFQLVLQLHEDAEVRDLGDVPLEVGPHQVAVGDVVLPRVLGELLDAEGDALLVLVDGQDDGLQDISLLDHLVGVADLAGPGHVADMEQAVDALLDLHERAVVGEVADAAPDDGADGVLLLHQIPGVLLDLLHAERDLLLLGVHVEDHHVHDVALVDDLVRVVDAACPRHLGDMDEPLDPFLQLDEGAVGHDVDHLALDLAAGLVAVVDGRPGRRCLLLQAEGDALGLLVELEHLDLHHVVDGEHLAGVVDAPPGHVGDVQEAVDASQVHERAEVGDVLDHAATNLLLLEAAEDLLLLLLAALLEQLAARDDDVHAGFVDLDDPGLDLLADVVADVAGAADLDL